MNIHYASGIVNKAFYTTLATTKSWTIKSTFRTFALANQLYWNTQSNFSDAACGVYQAAEDMDFNPEDVVHGFSVVGITPCDELNLG
ncbi:MAG: M4 family metallopeptidase [Shewanella sp.]|nr:M4 family metallopeptidase [Shewanella sp.]